MSILIQELPEYEVAFVRQVGNYQDTHVAWSTLTQWAARNDLLPPDQYCIGISLDDPIVVDPDACRYEACVTLPRDFQREGHSEVEFKKLAGGLYALHPFYDTADKLGPLYQYVYGQWFPESEYSSDDRHCLEFCMNNPALDPEGKFKVDLYVPVKKKA